MAYDQGLFGIAQRYYLLALHACRESSSPDLGAKIIGDMTQLSTALGHYEDSLTMVRTALYSLPRQASSLVRSRTARPGIPCLRPARGQRDRQRRPLGPDLRRGL